MLLEKPDRLSISDEIVDIPVEDEDDNAFIKEDRGEACVDDWPCAPSLPRLRCAPD